MHNKINTLFAALALMMMPGCMFSGSYWTGDYGDDDIGFDYTDPSARNVTFSSLDGQLGGHELDVAATEGIAYGGYGTTLELETIDEGTWMLFRMEIPADLYAPEYEEAQFFSSVDSGVELMGCTGDAPYEFDYDGYASDVEVQVSQGAAPDTRQVDWTATFEDGIASRQVTGTILIDLNAGTVAGERSTGATRPLSWNSVESDLGDQGSYSIPAASGTGFTDGFMSSMEFETTDYGQWVMFRLSSYETNLFSAQVGDVIEDVSMLGCTGDTPGNFDFDASTDEVTVQILPGATDAERIAHIVASWDTEWGTQTIEADVAYTVN
ncbi:MAG: hypothetical protein AB8I08_05810 [Sandaracinaceae bacterium]